MNHKSRDGACTITQWDAQSFRWHDEAPHLQRGALGRGSAGRVYVEAEPRSGMWPWLPPEALDWLNGQHEPPEPPIAAGDRVAIGSHDVRVIAVHEGYVWVMWPDGEPSTVAVTAVRRVGEAE